MFPSDEYIIYKEGLDSWDIGIKNYFGLLAQFIHFKLEWRKINEREKNYKIVPYKKGDEEYFFELSEDAMSTIRRRKERGKQDSDMEDIETNYLNGGGAFFVAKEKEVFVGMGGVSFEKEGVGHVRGICPQERCIYNETRHFKQECSSTQALFLLWVCGKRTNCST